MDDRGCEHVRRAIKVHWSSQTATEDSSIPLDATRSEFTEFRSDFKRNSLVGADNRAVLDQIVDSLTSLAHKSGNQGLVTKETNKIVVDVGEVQENWMDNRDDTRRKAVVLILSAGRVCQPAVELLASINSISSCEWSPICSEADFDEPNEVDVIVASLFLKDAEEIVRGIPNARALQLDVTDLGSLFKYVSKHRKQLVTASYVDDSLLKLDSDAKCAGVTILSEMGLDPGIDHMMAMKMINQAYLQGGKVQSFSSYCGGLPSPAAANNPLLENLEKPTYEIFTSKLVGI